MQSDFRRYWLTLKFLLYLILFHVPTKSKVIEKITMQLAEIHKSTDTVYLHHCSLHRIILTYISTVRIVASIACIVNRTPAGFPNALHSYQNQSKWLDPRYQCKRNAFKIHCPLNSHPNKLQISKWISISFITIWFDCPYDSFLFPRFKLPNLH